MKTSSKKYVIICLAVFLSTTFASCTAIQANHRSNALKLCGEGNVGKVTFMGSIDCT